VLKAAELGNEKCAALLETFSPCAVFRRPLRPRADPRLYAVTGVLEAVSAMPMGEGRRANLLMLVSHAAAFHNAGYKGLARFVGLLDRLAEQGGDLAPGSPGETANAVHIMSVHKSKGLEFPVVILADTARRFNLSDLRENTLLHSEYGFACRRRDKKLRLAYATLPMAAIPAGHPGDPALRGDARSVRGADPRREKLIITGRAEKAAPRARAPFRRKAARLHRRVGELLADWLIAALLHHPDAAALREAGGG
jgi:ATP-dependent helicase/nuclease subunit A